MAASDKKQSSDLTLNERLHTFGRLLESPKWIKSYQRFPKYFNWFFIILILYGMADLTWRLVPKPTLAVYKPASKLSKTIATRNLHIYSAAQINKWALFGKQTSIKPVKLAAVKVVEIKEATLNLTLKGITHSVHKHESYAIIMGTRGKQKNYKIGDVVPGNAKIEQILKNAVILLHNNEQVKLILKKSKKNKKNKRNINNLGSFTKGTATR